MKLTITIEMSNAAFDGEPGMEVARILRDLSSDYEAEGTIYDLARHTLRDINGNIVGRVEVIE